MSNRQRLTICLLTLCALASSNVTARAEDDEWALSLGPSFRGLSEATGDDQTTFRSVPGALVRLRYGMGDFFHIGASLDAGIALPTHFSVAAPVAGAFFELHYIIDIVTWVPFVNVGIGPLVRAAVPHEGLTKDSDDAELRVDLAVTVGGGIEYRPARAWAIGFAGRYELVVTDFDRVDAFSLTLFYTHFFE